ncbi:unnamed protein product [Diamesa hyperborea]
MEGTYEYELERAELLGVQPPDREKWEIQNKARKEAELENETEEIAQELEAEGEKIKSSGGKMDELHNILSITQMRINKFKNVCGSLSNLLKIRSDSPSRDEASTSANGEAKRGSINDALDDLETMKNVEAQSDLQFAKNAAIDINHQVSKNFDALDSLINKAETAELSLQRQNKQMKSYLK